MTEENITATEVLARVRVQRLRERAAVERLVEPIVDGYLTLLKKLGILPSNPHSEDIMAKARGDSNGCD
jgi:hypothetical protein